MKLIFTFFLIMFSAFAQFGAADHVRNQGATVPTSCSEGQLFQRTGATDPGMYVCSGGVFGRLLNVDATRQSAMTASIVNRHYDAISVVTTTIAAALAAISDATFAKRYLVYVPNGTYTEEIQMKDYVDVVGQSQSGVIVQSSSGTADTIKNGGTNSMLANLTVTHTHNTGDSGATQYPIHCDATSATGVTPSPNSTTIIYRVIARALGTDAKSGIGCGLYAYQRMYILDSTAYSQKLAGVYIHNSVSAVSSMRAYLVNVHSTSDGVANALDVQSIGSGRQDMVYVVGGYYSAPGGYDIKVSNSGAGAGEVFISIESTAKYSTSSFVDSSKVISLPAYSAVPSFSDPKQYEFLGDIYTGVGKNVYAGGFQTGTGDVAKGMAGIADSTNTSSGFFHWYKSSGSARTRLGYMGLSTTDIPLNLENGAKFKVLGGPFQLGGIADPTCAAATAGVVWYSGHAAGVKDTVQVCAADGSDVYAWRSIY